VIAANAMDRWLEVCVRDGAPRGVNDRARVAQRESDAATDASACAGDQRNLTAQRDMFHGIGA